MKNLSLLLFILLFRTYAHGQELLDVAMEHVCSYSGPLEPELYTNDNDASVPSIVRRILEATATPQNFELRSANVPSVVALFSGEHRYLLYSQVFYLQLPQSDKAVAYGLLAHAIGHLMMDHHCDGQFREKEELEADLFMGYALCKTSDVDLADALGILDKVPFQYTIAREKRREAIASGYKRANAHLRGKDNLGYFEDQKTNDELSMPRFPWPPPQCAQRMTLAENLETSCVNLTDVDQRLRRALDAAGYEQRSYFYVPNGYAVVTQLEQFTDDGSPKSGPYRWTDYPAQEQFSSIWAYLKSLVMPTPGHFRLFVFLVTDTPYSQSSKKVSKEEAASWLSQGFNRLPNELGKRPLGERSYLDVLVYEFEAPQSTKRCAQKCPSLLTIGAHLEKSGIRIR